MSPRKTPKKSGKGDSKAIEPEVVEHLPLDMEATPTQDESITTEPSPHLPALSTKGLAVTDPLAAYLQEVRNYPLLTPEQEQEVARRYYETKDPKAAEKLVSSNLRFVVKIAAEYSKFGARMIDLVQEGNVGLMHAVKDFNPYKGVRLITYAVWWIRGYIQEYLMRQYSLVRIGTTHNQRRLFYQLRQEQQKLEAMGEKMGIRMLSDRLGIPADEIQSMESRLKQRDVSLDAPLDPESGTSLMNFQSDNQSLPVDEELGRHEEISLLNESIEDVRKDLNEKEIFILENRLLSDTPLTLQEIGDKYGMTRERARQLEARIIEKIKKIYLSDQDAEG